jgi:hypothetical protein
MFKPFYWKEVVEYSWFDGKNTCVEPIDVPGPDGGTEIKRFCTVYGRDKGGLSTAIFDTPDNSDEAKRACIQTCYLLNKETF